MPTIRIQTANISIDAELQPSPTTQAIIDCLPYTSSANTWGDEVYFSLPVKASLDSDARQVVDPGTVCFWVEGSSLALPYGPTPISLGNECRLVSEVNVLGEIIGDAQQLAAISDGDEITVTLV